DQSAAVVSADVDDALSRSVPALENADARDALKVPLGQLESALAAGNLIGSREALSRSRAIFSQSGNASASSQTSFAGDQADLTAIELLLNQVALLLGTT